MKAGLSSKYLSVLLVIGIFCSAPPKAGPAGTIQAGEQLRFRFHSGDKFFLESSTELKTTRVVEGEVQRTEQFTRFGCDLDIEEVAPDGSYWARYTYTQTAIRIKGPDVDVDYDSTRQGRTTGGAVSPAAMLMEFIVGQHFYIKITPRGRIDRVNGLQAVVTAAKSRIPPALSRQDAEYLAGYFEQQLDESAVRRDLERHLAVFAPAVAGQGRADDTWSRTEQIGANEATAELTYRLVPSESPSKAGIAVIDVNIVIRPSDNTSQAGAGGSPQDASRGTATVEVSGTGTGRIEIEKSSGRIIISRLIEEIVEQVRFSPQGLQLRPPPAPEPTRTRMVMTFRMTRQRRAPDESGVDPNLIRAE